MPKLLQRIKSGLRINQRESDDPSAHRLGIPDVPCSELQPEKVSEFAFRVAVQHLIQGGANPAQFAPIGRRVSLHEPRLMICVASRPGHIIQIPLGVCDVTYAMTMACANCSCITLPHRVLQEMAR